MREGIVGTVLLVVTGALGLLSCGEEGMTLDDSEPTAAVIVPEWANVAPEQITDAKRYGVPVAFENELGMRFVLIPAATFSMGSPEDEKDRERDEALHEVRLTEPYYMQVSELTNAHFRRFRSSHTSGRVQFASWDEDDQPVVEVSWQDATAFAAWSSDQGEGRTYRLPTEAEWEFACRAGTSTRFSFQDRDEEFARYMNFADRRCPISDRPVREDLDDGHGVTAPVGSYLPNAWGLHDMHGNASEWCHDVYGPYPGGWAEYTPGPSREGALGDDVRVCRGGSWRSLPRFLRSANRGWKMADSRDTFTGFRLVSPLPEKAD